MIALVLAAYGAPPASGWPDPVDRPLGKIPHHAVQALDLLEVLDIDDRHAALRVIWHEEEDPDNGRTPVDCEYAGMQKYPISTVDLVVFELATGTPQVFTVYGGAVEEAACMSREASEKALAAAKARMAEVGLDPAKKPAPLDGNQVTRDWGTAKLEGVEKRSTDGMMMGAIAWSVEAGGHVLYRSEREYGLAMAGSAKMMPLKAWAVPSGVVVLEHTEYFSGRGGFANHIGVTPVLKVP
ncbi:MAG: hypothetical protein R3F61_05585 [Myxococcota bacterium]